jgi:hypothetical protein
LCDGLIIGDMARRPAAAPSLLPAASASDVQEAVEVTDRCGVRQERGVVGQAGAKSNRWAVKIPISIRHFLGVNVAMFIVVSGKVVNFSNRAGVGLGV